MLVELQIPEAPDRGPRTDARLTISVGHNQILAGLLNEYFESIGIIPPINYRSSSIRGRIRSKEELQTLYNSLKGHSIQLIRGLGFLVRNDLNQNGVLQDAESTIRYVKTLRTIHPHKRDSDQLCYSVEEVSKMLGQSHEELEPFELPNKITRDSLSREYMGGVADAIAKPTLYINRNPMNHIGFGIMPQINIRKSGFHPVTVSLIHDALDDAGIEYRDPTPNQVYTINVTIAGPDDIQSFYDTFGDELQTSLPIADIFVTEILPRFKEDLHKTKQGFFDILYLAEKEIQLFERDRKYDLNYFANRWCDDIDTYGIEDE